MMGSEVEGYWDEYHGGEGGVRVDSGRLYVGGLAFETTVDLLKNYFSRFGEVSDAIIMRDKITNQPRGFGFITFKEPEAAARVLETTHKLDGRELRLGGADAIKPVAVHKEQLAAKAIARGQPPPPGYVPGGGFGGGRHGGDGFRCRGNESGVTQCLCC